MRTLHLLIALCFFLASCGNNTNISVERNDGTSTHPLKSDNPNYDPERGIGRFKDIKIDAKLDVLKADAGFRIYSVKCLACHKLTDEKLVGPGLKDATHRHKPEWIMNFLTNTDAMISTDPMLQAELRICLVRMPNQFLDNEEARNLLEFLRKNDGVE